MTNKIDNYNSIGDPSKKIIDWSKINTVDIKGKDKKSIKYYCPKEYMKMLGLWNVLYLYQKLYICHICDKKYCKKNNDNSEGCKL